MRVQVSEIDFRRCQGRLEPLAHEAFLVEVQEPYLPLGLLQTELLVVCTLFVDTGVDALRAVAVPAEVEHAVQLFVAALGCCGSVKELADQFLETVFGVGSGRFYACGIDVAAHPLVAVGQEIVVVEGAVAADKAETQSEVVVEAVGRNGRALDGHSGVHLERRGQMMRAPDHGHRDIAHQHGAFELSFGVQVLKGVAQPLRSPVCHQHQNVLAVVLPDGGGVTAYGC